MDIHNSKKITSIYNVANYKLLDCEVNQTNKKADEQVKGVQNKPKE